MASRPLPRVAAGLVAAIVVAASGCAGPAQQTPAPSQVPSEAASPTSAEPSTTPPATASQTADTPAPSPTATASAPATPRPSVTPTTRPSARPTAQPTTPAPPSSACSIPAALRGKDLTSMGTSAKVIALTFDGGGSNAGTTSILATLADMDKPATFFLTGDFADAYPEAARRIAAAYPLGNHTQNHLKLTTLTDTRVVDEIRAGAAAIRRATGVDPRPYFRFPEGDRDARTIGLVNQECYVPFRWTVDTLGWKGTRYGGMTAAKVTQRVLDGATPGGIVLMHLGANPDDGTTLDADALPGIIRGLREKGYTLVTLERVLPAAP